MRSVSGRTSARRARRRSERGVVAVITAICLTMLLLSVAMVLDLGAVRIDRQVNKMAADAAATAGLRGLDKGDGYPYSFRGVCQASPTCSSTALRWGR